MGPLFLTGASGFVGRQLLTALAARPGNLTCLARNPESLAALLAGRPGWRAVAGDLAALARDPAPLSGARTIVHLAARTGKASAAEFNAANVEGTSALLAAARSAGVQRLIFVSSIAAAFPDRRYYPYAESKRAAEALVRESGLDIAILRPTMIFGAGSPVFTGLAKLAAGPAAIALGGGHVRVQPIHVDDIVSLILALAAEAQLGGRVLEAGGPETLTMRELLSRIRQRVRGVPGPILPLPLEPLRTLLGLIEPVALPLLPLTAGQLASFANDSVATPDPWVGARATGFHSVDQMLAEGGTGD